MRLLHLEQTEDLREHLAVVGGHVDVDLAEDFEKLVQVKDLTRFRHLLHPVTQLDQLHLDVVLQLITHTRVHLCTRLLLLLTHSTCASRQLSVSVHCLLLPEREFYQNQVVVGIVKAVHR